MSEYWYISIISAVAAVIFGRMLDFIIKKFIRRKTIKDLKGGKYIKCPFCHKRNMHRINNSNACHCSCGQGSWNLETVIRNL